MCEPAQGYDAVIQVYEETVAAQTRELYAIRTENKRLRDALKVLAKHNCRVVGVNVAKFAQSVLEQ